VILQEEIMSAFDRVMANPRSLGARYALLEEWQAANDPRTKLLEYQLGYRRNGSRYYEIHAMIREHGRTWAGRVADLVEKFDFHLGLVDEVTLSGEQFLKVGAELYQLAPILHVLLTQPLGSIDAIANSPLLARLSSLHINGAGLGDAGAAALAASPHLSNINYLALCSNEITLAGVEALVKSKYLANTEFIDLGGNPANPTPYRRYEGDAMAAGEYVLYLQPLASTLVDKFGSRPWLEPPTGNLETWANRTEMAIDYDYIHSPVLRELEARAAELAEVEQLLAEAGDNDIAINVLNGQRARLLSDLNREELLTGDEDVGIQVRECPTLTIYHEAAVKMRLYLSSFSRERMFPDQEPPQPSSAVVSLDWFRFPSDYAPDRTDAPGYKMDEWEWLSRCERAFIEEMPKGTGTRYVPFAGEMHALHYRQEDGPTPRLLRAEPVRQAEPPTNDPIEDMAAPTPVEVEKQRARKERQDQLAAFLLQVETKQLTRKQIVQQALAGLIARIEMQNPECAISHIDVPILVGWSLGTLRYGSSTMNRRERYAQLMVWGGDLESRSPMWTESGTQAEMLAFFRRPDIFSQFVS
jgi:hypothetical protein